MLWNLITKPFIFPAHRIPRTEEKMKKRNACASGFLLCILFLQLVFTSSVYGRSLSAENLQEGDQKIVAYGTHPNKEDDSSNLMGLDMVECEKEDEECVARRIMAEAHLDYIYTQSQNPT